MNLTPIAKTERVQLLDILRGFAILGIFLANAPSMLGIQPANAVRVFEGFDSVMKLGFDLLVTHKFYPIFAWLFGVGFWIFISRAEAKGKNAPRLYLRRSALLLGFGLLHGVLLWEGDVLEFYAVHGLAILLFYKRKPKTILIWAAWLMFTFWTVVGIVTFVAAPSESLLYVPESYNAISGYAAEFMARVTVYLPEKWATTVVFLLDTLPLFLLGMYVAKTGLLQKLDSQAARRLLPRVQWISLAAATLLSIPIVVHYATQPVYTTSGIMLFLFMQGKALALFFVTSIVRWHASAQGKRLLSPFSYAGRMALTNYMMHTVVTMLVVALFVENTAALHLWQVALYCLGVYAAQIILSRLWLARFSQGPLEWLWRKGTYGWKTTQTTVPKMAQSTDAPRVR